MIRPGDAGVAALAAAMGTGRTSLLSVGLATVGIGDEALHTTGRRVYSRSLNTKAGNVTVASIICFDREQMETYIEDGCACRG
jgi:hypothetical protein